MWTSVWISLSFIGALCVGFDGASLNRVSGTAPQQSNISQQSYYKPKEHDPNAVDPLSKPTGIYMCTGTVETSNGIINSLTKQLS